MVPLSEAMLESQFFGGLRTCVTADGRHRLRLGAAAYIVRTVLRKGTAADDLYTY